MATALLTTKLFVPPLRPSHVPRPRLVERVRAGLDGPLTLLVAPAGFGKTTLLSDAIAGRRVAWVSLDAADNDSARFWSYILAALDTFHPGLSSGALALLQAPQPPIETILTTLLNTVTAWTTDVVLVLDDYHLIEAPPIHQALHFLLDHRSPRLHLVLASRTDPPVPVSRLRVRGELTELRAADLRFTPDEAIAFLTEVMQLPLSSAAVAALDTRTEGWIAGLQLAALALRDRTDSAGFIAAFTGSHRFVIDYLAEEVLDRLPHHLQTFLLQTAILDRLCGPLCDAVRGVTDDHPRTTSDSNPTVDPRPSPMVGADDSQRLLEQLERASLFLMPLDDARQWYRYHHLFADVLRARVSTAATANDVATLHQRASAWYEQQGLLIDAVQHALSAQDWERAARVIQDHGAVLLLTGQIHTVLRWLHALPDAVVQRSPRLCLVYATGLLLTMHLDAAELRLRDAERSVPPETHDDGTRVVRGNVALLRGCIHLFAGDLAQGLRLMQETLDLLPETPMQGSAGPVSARLRSTAAIFAATAAYRLTGDVSAASERRTRATIAAARAMFGTATLGASIALAALQLLQGRLRAAAATLAGVEQLDAGQDGLRNLIGSPAYYLYLGDLHREWNDLDAAETSLARGMELVAGGMGPDADVLMRGYLALARVQQARGNADAALATLDAFVHEAHERGFVALLSEQAEAMRAQLQLLQRDLPAALRWAETSGLSPTDAIEFPREGAYLSLARVRIAAGDAAAVLPLLQRLLTDAEGKARLHSAIEIMTVQALADAALAERPRARRTLERALVRAEPEGYVRLFVDAGDPMAALLAEIARTESPVAAYAAMLLAAFPTPRAARAGTAEPPTPMPAVPRIPHPALVEPLTEREREILQLVADGYSNQAIAATLVVAVSTVKKHINNLYGKLAVQSRTQALVRARELDLL